MLKINQCPNGSSRVLCPWSQGAIILMMGPSNMLIAAMVQLENSAAVKSLTSHSSAFKTQESHLRVLHPRQRFALLLLDDTSHGSTSMKPGMTGSAPWACTTPALELRGSQSPEERLIL